MGVRSTVHPRLCHWQNRGFFMRVALWQRHMDTVLAGH